MTETKRKVSIAIDAMGGDYAPQEIVSGTVAAARDGDIETILVGPQDILEAELSKYDTAGLPIRCVNAEGYIKEEGNPALAARSKPKSSIAIATKLVKSGEAQAIIGATATGTLVTSALQYLGMIEGIERPVIGGVLTTIAPKTAIFDLGVNMDCRPQHLVNFAAIGAVYARLFLDIPNPKVALLNVGKEETKGSKVVQEAYRRLSKSSLNFVGNVEGDQILSGEVNVIICDAFVGNCVFKLCENGGKAVGNHILKKMEKYPLVNNLFKGKIKKAMRSLEAPESLGNGVIWGIDGLVMKLHGHCRSDDVTDKFFQARRAIEKDVITNLKTELAKVRENTK